MWEITDDYHIDNIKAVHIHAHTLTLTHPLQDRDGQSLNNADLRLMHGVILLLAYSMMVLWTVWSA